MEGDHQQSSMSQQRKGQKRKLEEDPSSSSAMAIDIKERVAAGEIHHHHLSPEALAIEVKSQVEILQSSFSWQEPDRLAAKRATNVLAELAKNGIPSIYLWILLWIVSFSMGWIDRGILVAEEVVNVIVEAGAVPALVKHLMEPPAIAGGERPFQHEVEKGSAFALGLLAVKVYPHALSSSKKKGRRLDDIFILFGVLSWKWVLVFYNS